MFPNPITTVWIISWCSCSNNSAAKCNLLSSQSTSSYDILYWSSATNSWVANGISGKESTSFREIVNVFPFRQPIMYRVNNRLSISWLDNALGSMVLPWIVYSFILVIVIFRVLFGVWVVLLVPVRVSALPSRVVVLSFWPVLGMTALFPSRSYVLYMQPGRGHKTSSHRAIISFIGLPFWTLWNCSLTATTVKYPQSTISFSYVAMINLARCFGIYNIVVD